MLDERNNRLSCSSSRPAPTTLAAHSGVLGLLRSAGKTAPQIAAAAVHQAVCTRRALHPRCNSLRSGEAVASGRQPPAAVVGCRAGPRGQPHASLVFLGVGWTETPVVVRYFFHMYNIQNVLIPCVENVRVGHLGYAPGTTLGSLAVWRQMPADHLSMIQSDKAQRGLAPRAAAKAQRWRTQSHQRKQYGGLPRVVPKAEPTPAPSVAFEDHFIAARPAVVHLCDKP